MNKVMILDYVGLALIFQKKECIIDGEKQIFFRKIDCAYGFWNYFNADEMFVVLTGKLAGALISKNSIYDCSAFKTIRTLSNENNHLYDYKKFMTKYSEGIGEYYTYSSNTNSFSKITDQELLQKLKGTTKDYGDTIVNNDLNISQIYSEVKKTIISQDKQIMQILTSLFKNQKVINSSLSPDIITKLKENVIVYGSTGTGKTEILKRIANAYKIPIVIEDATSLSETGYVGRNITDMLEDIYLAADEDIEKAQKSILVIDEFDKLAEKNNNSNDHVSRIGVQRSLLKLLDGSTFYFGDKKFDTSRLSIVALGAFTGMVDNDNYSNVSSTDFVNYGIMRELMSRFSNSVAMNPLSTEDIKKILIKSDFSPLNTYKLLFDSMDMNFSYDENFIDYIAEKAMKLNSGARSLKTVFDNAIGDAMFEVFTGEYSAINLTKPTNGKTPYVLIKR